jgi:drug/metabolite transporter (DMT)-like permease
MSLPPMNPPPGAGFRAPPGSEAAGILWVLVNTAMFALIFTVGKLLDGTVHAIQIMFIRYLAGFFTMLVVAQVYGGVRRYRSPRPWRHVARAVCGACGGASAFYAATYMPVADAAAIGLLKGVLVVFLAIVVLREVVTGRHWLAAIACAAGGFVVIWGKGAGFDFGGYGAAATVALLGAVMSAGEAICIRMLAISEPPIALTLYVSGLGALVLLIPAALVWETPPWPVLLFLVSLGPISVLGQYFNVRGYQLAPASLLAPVFYSNVVFAAFWGYVLFAEVPGPMTWAGSALIIAGGVWLSRLPAQKVRPPG